MNTFIQYGGHIIWLLPIIVYLIDIPIKLKYILLALLMIDLYFNAYLKNIIMKLGLQTKRPIYDQLSGPKSYGMPSGHTEICWMLLSFYVLYGIKYKSFEKNFLAYSLLILFTILTMYHRYASGMHDIYQIFGGMITGSLIGIITFVLFIENQQ